MSTTTYNVQIVTTLGLIADDHAKVLMDGAVYYGNILLNRHRMTVVKVLEFFPDEEQGLNLVGLNVNKGVEIKLRLRRTMPPAKCTHSAAMSAFFTFDEILCTMIHEIVHCTIGPHNGEFWKLNNKLVAEVEEIRRGERSVTGTGTTAASRRIGPLRWGTGQTLGGSAVAGAPPLSRENVRKQRARRFASRTEEGAPSLAALADQHQCGSFCCQEAPSVQEEKDTIWCWHVATFIRGWFSRCWSAVAHGWLEAKQWRQVNVEWRVIFILGLVFYIAFGFFQVETKRKAAALMREQY